jgi:outer membrane protein OmpA-like peptidoglycan-associated protein
LYFVSNRRGGLGGRDIWVSHLSDSNTWEPAVNLGSGINTPREDVSPFIHPNNFTLFFASNGRTGFGGYDIYYAERQGNDWSEVENFGAPINTGEDQVSLFITADGSKGYYSLEDQSDLRKKSVIYEFDIPQELQISTRASYVYGKILDAETKEPLSAGVELYDLARQERVGFVDSDPETGNYLIVLAEGNEYGLYVNRNGYVFQSLSFSYATDPVEQDVELVPIRTGSKTVLQNIFFDTDKFVVKERSYVELNKVIRFMSDNEGVRIEVSGHTDDVGADEYNLDLSEKRAKSVYDYLTQNGVSKDRLTYRGYGETQPAVPNSNDANRSQNRRIEFKIIE